MRRILLVATLLLGILVAAAHAEPAFKADFDEACAKTDQAMGLSVAELNQLLERCGKVRKMLEKEDETVRKVYLRRIEMCENLYRFVLDTKQRKTKEEAAK